MSRKQQLSQLFIDISPRADKDDIEARLIIVKPIDDSTCPDSMRPKPRQLILKYMPGKGRNEQILDTLLDLSLDLWMELPDSVSGLLDIPRTIPFHDASRPKTAS